MGKVEQCRETLAGMPRDQWDSFLQAGSNLPGPRANLELAWAAADIASEGQARTWLEKDQPALGTDDPRSFLTFIATITLGGLIAEGRTSWLKTLRALASDGRWRIREAVCMALGRIGGADRALMHGIAENWATGNLLEARAAAAGVADPDLAKHPEFASTAVGVLDLATRKVAEAADTKSEDYRTLKQGLSYCWSVVAVACPAETKPAMEAWFASENAGVKQIMKEDLKKNRMAKSEPEWTATWLKRL